MAAEVVPVSRWHQFTSFIQDSYHEIRYRTTWPDVAQVRQASIAIMIFVLIVSLVITLLDLILRGVLIQLIPSLFR